MGCRRRCLKILVVDDDPRLRSLADDYVIRPFSPRQLVARIKAILKRTRGGSGSGTLRHGVSTLDPRCHACAVGAADVALTGTLGLAFVGLIILRLPGPVTGYRPAALIVGGVILLATPGPGFLFLRPILRPLTQLSRATGDLCRDPMARPEPLAHCGSGELRAPGESVLDMARRLQDREATIRSFTDHVTHEMKTPLSAVKAATELLEDADLDPASRRLVATITGAARQMERRLKALRQAAAAREPGHRCTACPAELLPALAAAHPGLKLTVSGGDTGLPLDAAGLGIVLQQLLTNAVAAGAGEVRLSAMPGRPGVADDGRGISDGNRDHGFEPFLTTRRDSGGTGKGLTVAATLLAAHGAENRLLRPDQGAAFEIDLDSASDRSCSAGEMLFDCRREGLGQGLVRLGAIVDAVNGRDLYHLPRIHKRHPGAAGRCRNLDRQRV